MNSSILIIEDNPLNLQLATDLLEIAGYYVLQAADAEQGLRVAAENPPHLVLMDLSLPGMDGAAAMRELKNSARTRHIPVVALTAHAMKGDDVQALRDGFDGYLEKPINTRTFAGQVSRFLTSKTPMLI